MIFFDRVAFFTPTTGTGTVEVDEPISPAFFLPSEAGVEDGTARIPYVIVDGTNVEIGYGTYVEGSTDTFSRDEVLASKVNGTAGTSKITLSGSAQVRFTLVADLVAGLVRSKSNVQTDDYTLALGDAGNTVRMNVATENDLTVPAHGDVPFPVDTFINIEQYGEGQTVIVPDDGVTIRSRNGLKLAGQYALATLHKIGEDEWIAGGDLDE